ncbi:hypothetical protein ACFL9T_16070 [Thermodesulfobacteriota bacterium]
MLTVPSKPMRKLKARPEGEGRYTLTFTSPLKNEDEFEMTIKEVIGPFLAESDVIFDLCWETKSFSLTTTDLKTIQRELIHHLIIIKIDTSS